jgi:photosystem II stability/assembly factor-like uncharacterized protein
MYLGFNTTGNSQTSRRTTNAISLGKLRNTSGSITRKFKYCNRNSPDLNFTFKCVFDIPMQTIISGQYQIAVGNNAFSISRDYGINWQILSQFAALSLRSVAISNNGQYILTGGNGTPLFYSNDNGKTFIQKFPADPGNGWFSISMSRSGQYQTAIGPTVLSGGEIYVSNDYGNTFNIILQPIVGSIQSYLTMSYDGKYQSITSGNSIFISNNYGQNWTQNNLSGITNPPSSLYGITMSGNGQIQYAVDEGFPAYLYKSTNYGITWNNTYTIPESGTLYFISTSETGQYVLIPNYNGSIWISNNYGNSFTKNINIDGQPQSSFGFKSWYPCGVSASGKYQTACDNASNGYIYTSSDYGKNWYSRLNGGQSAWWGFFMNL